MKAKVTRKSIGRREVRKGGKGKALVVYRVGDEIEVSDSELRNFGDRLEVVKEEKATAPRKSYTRKTRPSADDPTDMSKAGSPDTKVSEAEVSDSGDI